MRRRPPTKKKPFSGVLVIAIAMPLSKASTPTTAAVVRLDHSNHLGASSWPQIWPNRLDRERPTELVSGQTGPEASKGARRDDPSAILSQAPWTPMAQH